MPIIAGWGCCPGCIEGWKFGLPCIWGWGWGIKTGLSMFLNLLFFVEQIMINKNHHLSRYKEQKALLKYGNI